MRARGVIFNVPLVDAQIEKEPKDGHLEMKVMSDEDGKKKERTSPHRFCWG
jgi:hypothetical protein